MKIPSTGVIFILFTLFVDQSQCEKNQLRRTKANVALSPVGGDNTPSITRYTRYIIKRGLGRVGRLLVFQKALPFNLPA